MTKRTKQTWLLERTAATKAAFKTKNWNHSSKQNSVISSLIKIIDENIFYLTSILGGVREENNLENLSVAIEP